MIGSITNIHKSIMDLERNPTNGKKQIDTQTLDDLRNYARSMGADEIGYSSISQEWIFKNLAIRYTQAIVLTMEMDKDRMNLAPNPDTAAMVHETYNQLGPVSNNCRVALR